MAVVAGRRWSGWACQRPPVWKMMLYPDLHRDVRCRRRDAADADFLVDPDAAAFTPSGLAVAKYPQGRWTDPVLLRRSVATTRLRASGRLSPAGSLRPKIALARQRPALSASTFGAGMIVGRADRNSGHRGRTDRPKPLAPYFCLDRLAAFRAIPFRKITFSDRPGV